MTRFADRRDAGRQLARRLGETALGDPLILGLPRGGIPVAYEVAAGLSAPLEVFVARKIGAPGHEELGIAAIAEGLDEPVVTDLVARLGVSAHQLAVLAAREHEVHAGRVARYRAGRALPALGEHDVVLVDDGLATGITAEAALRALRRLRPRRLVLAVPVCSPDTANRLSGIADQVLCLSSPDEMYAVGLWYSDFTQTTDGEVVTLLERSRALPARG
ncbi:MAG: phosphoribosyltransferase [Acidimicrobiia bacterium]